MSMRSLVKRIPGATWLASRFRTREQNPEISHGEAGIRQVGHRDYVGGLWEQIGRLQFDFLLSQGLQPHHYLLDIACGSLRAGIHFIPYLEPGHYLGIEKEKELIQAGIERELGRELHETKQPVLIVNGDFEFDRFGIRPDFALAQSLFTHIPHNIINKCFINLRAVMADNGAFYATFFETTTEVDNPSQPHDNKSWMYTREQMEAFGRDTGWVPQYIGHWQHPRGQVMVCYRPS